MRESIGATWILQLVIVFMLIFVAFLALSVNYTKAYKIKNEVVTIIEKYEGVSSNREGSIEIINNYLRYYNYQTMGSCEEGYYGVNNLNSTNIDPAGRNQKYYYCVKRNDTSSDTHNDRANYEIITFFQFNLPFVGDLFTFRVNGTTIDINFPNDDIPEILS